MRIIYNKNYSLEVIMKVINIYLCINKKTINTNVHYILDTNSKP